MRRHTAPSAFPTRENAGHAASHSPAAGRRAWRHGTIGLLVAVCAWGCQPQPPRFPSGAPYTHHVQNEGPKPQAGDVVSYHLVNHNAEGLQYSSYEEGRPRRMRMPVVGPHNPASDLTEALLLMSVGDSLSFQVKPEHLPRQHQAAATGGLSFGVKLLDIQTQAEQEAEAERIHDKGKQAGTLTRKAIGTMKERGFGFPRRIGSSTYRYVERGTGPQLSPGDRVSLHYQTYPTHDYSKPIRDSYATGQPVRLQLGKGEAIPAWEGLLPLLRVGDEVMMHIPPKDGIGAAQGSDWVVYLEVLSRD